MITKNNLHRFQNTKSFFCYLATGYKNRNVIENNLILPHYEIFSIIFFTYYLL